MLYFVFFAGAESISMIDPVIDEHFRRSLGADYMHLFEKKAQPIEPEVPASVSTASPRALTPPIPVKRSKSPPDNQPIERIEPQSTVAGKSSPNPIKKQKVNIEMSVDDHFAKALGDTWKKLQEADKSLPNVKKSSDDSDNNSS